MKGAVAKTNAATNMTLFLPTRSESEPAGRLTKMPGMVDAEAIRPNEKPSAPRLEDNKGRTGFFDIVELSIASAPAVLSP